jgi:cation:H+ antiporter
MTGSLIQFLVSAIVIVVAGAGLTVFGEVISQRTRIGGLLVGSILIAGATSLPELAIDISAVRQGSVDLAVGDLLGSSLFNLGILAVLDLTRYSKGRMFSHASARHAVAGSVSIALTAIAGLFIFLGPRAEGATLGRMGLGSGALIVSYFLGLRIMYRSEKQERSGDSDQSGNGSTLRWAQLSLKRAVLGYAIAAAVILAAAPFLAKAAADLAERSGLGGTFFGTTFVALCTSLPEIVTTFSAVRMKSFDLAVGNILGSNCFNMVIVATLDVADEGSLLSAADDIHVYTALCVIVVTAVVILGQLYRVERRRHFLEADAWLALLLILASLTGLYFVRE